MKNKKKLYISMIILGLILLNIKVIYSYLMERKITKIDAIYEDLNKEDLTNKSNIDYNYDFEIIDHIKPDANILNISESMKESIIGRLKIESVGIDLILFEGISNDKLLAGVCTMKENQVLGEGNYSIAGHYGFNNKLLYNLKNVELDDLIELEDKENIYIYKVVDKKIVQADRIDMIEDDRAKLYSNSIVSIMNCDYDNNIRTGKRLFVIGELVEILKYDNQR